MIRKQNYYAKTQKLLSLRNPLWKHGAVVFFLMQLLYAYYSPWYKIFILSVLITLAHIIVDHLKLVHHNKYTKKMAVFFVDQGLHIGMIYLLCATFFIEETPKYIALIGKSKLPVTKQFHFRISLIALKHMILYNIWKKFNSI